MRYYIALFLILAARAFGAINVENGAADVITYFVLVDQTTGDRDIGVTIANLEMYYIEDQAAESANAFVGTHGAVTDAHTAGECIHVGHGLYRIDWPDAAFDGGVGKRVQLTVVDGDDGAKTETLEVLLSPPSNTTQLDGSDIVQASGVVAANTTQLGGVTQSLTDLKDFADAGYNPATDKVTGVLLADTTIASTNAETAIGNLKDFDSANDAVAVVTLLNGLAANVITETSINDGAITDAKIATVGVNLIQVNGNTTPINNWEDMFDGTGYANDNAPATQLQLSTTAGGVSVSTTATGINIDEPNGGEQTLTYVVTATHDGTYHEVASDDANNDIDFYYTFNTGDGDNLPVEFHMHGYYEDNNAPASSTMVIQSYNFNIADWETIITLTDSASDIALDLPLHVHDVDPDGGTEGEVRIRFNLTTPEVSQNVRINHVTVGYVSGGLTAAAVVNEWESQSQSNPTGFHVNLLEVEGADATTYWESRSLAAAAYFLYGSDDVAVVTLLNGLTDNVITAASINNTAIDAATFAADVDAEIAAYILNALTNAYGGAGTYGQALEDTLADTNELQTDWTNGGRLDLIIDIIQAYWDSLTITGGYLEVDIVNLDGTNVKSTSGNIHALPGNI